jgi:nicotinamidase-related amidase
VTAPVQALVVVDMQRGLLAGPHAVVGAAALTARVEELIGRATAACWSCSCRTTARPGRSTSPAGPAGSRRWPAAR